jgi:hypothetical protein
MSWETSLWWSEKTELWDDVRKAVNPARLKGGSWVAEVEVWAMGLGEVSARSGAVEPGGKSCPAGCSEECSGGLIGAGAEGIANRLYICSISSGDLLVWAPKRSET